MAGIAAARCGGLRGTQTRTRSHGGTHTQTRDAPACTCTHGGNARHKRTDTPVDTTRDLQTPHNRHNGTQHTRVHKGHQHGAARAEHHPPRATGGCDSAHHRVVMTVCVVL